MRWDAASAKALIDRNASRRPRPRLPPFYPHRRQGLTDGVNQTADLHLGRGGGPLPGDGVRSVNGSTSWRSDPWQAPWSRGCRPHG